MQAPVLHRSGTSTTSIEASVHKLPSKHSLSQIRNRSQRSSRSFTSRNPAASNPRASTSYSPLVHVVTPASNGDSAEPWAADPRGVGHRGMSKLAKSGKELAGAVRHAGNRIGDGLNRIGDGVGGGLVAIALAIFYRPP
eukprot:tig00000402_g243.t1